MFVTGKILAGVLPKEVEHKMARIVVDEDRCKGCEICVSVCPKRVIELADHFNRQGYRPARMVKARAVVPALVGGGMAEESAAAAKSRSENECNGCTLCARMCPDVAITVYR